MAIIIFITVCSFLTAYVFYGKHLFKKRSSENALADNIIMNESNTLIHYIKRACASDVQKNPLISAVFGWFPVLLWIIVISLGQSMKQSSFSHKKRLTAATVAVSMVLPLCAGFVPLRAIAEAFPVLSSASGLVVTNTNDSGAGSLRNAISSASDGDTVTFDIQSDGMQVITLNSILNVGNKKITIDGTTQSAKVELKVSGNFRHISTDADFIIKSLTFNGNNQGGGLYMYNYKSLTAENCEFINNTADFGGGIYMFGAAEVKNCIFESNAANQGGGIYAGYNDIAVYNSEFINNKAVNGNGGGIYVKNKVELVDTKFEANESTNWGGGVLAVIGLTAENCTFINNKAGAYGGGAASDYNISVKNNCIFEGNEAVDRGGGIHSWQGPVTAENCTFKDNKAESGAGVSSEYGALTTNSCIFKSNEVAGWGGGIVAWQGDITAFDCTFKDNEAYQGGGVHVDKGTATVIGCAFNNNTATLGGALWANGAADTGIIAINSTFANNTTTGEYGAAVQTNYMESQNINLFHCTTANNDGKGVSANGNIFAYNCIIDGNSGEQTEGTVSGGNNLIGDTTGFYFNNNIVTFGYIMPLPISGINNAAPITESDIISVITDAVRRTEILKALEYDQTGNMRKGTSATYGAVEPTAKTWVVDNSDDSGAGSLRDVIVNNVNNDYEPDYRIITFSDGVTETITLTSGEIQLMGSDNGTIVYGRTNDSGKPEITVSGNDNSRVFYCENENLKLYGLTVKDGKVNQVGENGGGLYASYSVDLYNCVFENNYTGVQSGGGVNSNNGPVNATDCMFIGNFAYDSGGGIFSNSDTENVTITRCTFTDNKVNRSGGGVYANADINSENCIFTENIANAGSGILTAKNVNANDCVFTKNNASYGGGIYAEGTWNTNDGGYTWYLERDGNVIAKNCIFTDNTASDGSGKGSGGGVYANGAVMVSENCEFINNTSNWGGGIYSDTGTVAAEECRFSRNDAKWGGGVWANDVNVRKSIFDLNTAVNGGGIYSNGTVVASDGCEFIKNTADWGGGIYTYNGNINAENCKFTENKAMDNGGALSTGNGEITVIGTTFTENNSVKYGGSVYMNNYEKFTAQNSDFYNNTASYGGGIMIFGDAELNNCIFTGNTSTNSGGALYAGNDIIAVNCMFTLNEANGAAVKSGTKAELYHCTVANNTGTGIDSAMLNLQNSIIAGNTAKQTIYTDSDGNSLVEGENNLTYAKIFGVNTVSSDGIIKVLGGGKADKTITCLSDGSANSGILALLAKDLNGATRSSSGKVTYGAIEETEDSIANISGSIERSRGDDLNLQNDEEINIEYTNGGTGTVPLTDIDVTVSGYNQNSATHSATVEYLGVTGMLTVYMNKISSSLSLEYASDGTHNKNITLTATLKRLSGGAITGADIVFSDGVTTLGTAQTNSNGKAILSIALSDGTHNITAVFGGDEEYKSDSDGIVVVTTPHTWSDWTTKSNATCDSDGVEEHTCLICSEEETRIINKTGHDWDDGAVSILPTYLSDGIMLYTCKNDSSHTRTETIDKLIDSTSPEIEISIGGNIWNTLSSGIAFDTFYNVTQTVSITASDGQSGVDNIYYYKSGTELTQTQIDNLTTSWTEGTIFNVLPNDDFIVYVKAVDKTGNIGYASTTGIVLDATVPVISGLSDGTVYCETQNVTVTDAHLSGVTVNGVGVILTGDAFSLAPAIGTQTITAADSAGNTATVTVTVNNGHELSSDGVITLEPTCTSDGIKTLTCIHDNSHTDTEIIPSSGHDYEKKYNPDEQTEYWQCSVCGDTTDSEPHIHTFDEWETITDATCTATGTEKRICTECGADEERIIPMIAHDFGEWETTLDANCTSDGYKNRECSVCGIPETGVITALGHDYSTDWTTDLEAACETSGSKSRHCTRCDDKIDITEISARGHDYSTDWTTDLETACETSGSKSRHCTRCDDKTDITVIPASGHTWNEWETVTEPDCENNGSEERTCSVCNTEETQSIEALGHDYITDWTTDSEATCETSGSKSRHCTRCDEKTDITIIPASGHTWNEWETVTEPDCENNGSEERICSVCNTEETQSIEALGHDYITDWTTDSEATCETPGSKSHHCTRCDDKTDITVITATGHNYIGSITINSTCTKTGIKTYVCEHDSNHTYTEVIDKQFHDGIKKYDEEKEQFYLECSVCGIKYDYLNHIHIYNDWEIIKEPDCDETGFRKRVCYECNNIDTQDINALGHDWENEYIIDIPATYTEKGSKSKHCKRNGCNEKTDITEIPQLDNGVYAPPSVIVTEPPMQNDELIIPATEEPIAKLRTEVIGNGNNNKPLIVFNAEADNFIEALGLSGEIEKGNSVDVVVEIADIFDTISKEDREFIASSLLVGEEIGMFIDISLFSIITEPNGNSTKTQYNETSQMFTITIVVPEELRGNESYAILRMHDGEVEKFEALYDPETHTLSFQTDRFSTYAIVINKPLENFIPDFDETADSKTNDAEEITKIDANPGTGYVYSSSVIGMISAGVLIITTKKRGKKKD